MKDFFISYNKADRLWAEWMAWQLEEVGYSTVLQAWDFRPGFNFVLGMHKASSEAKRTIAVLSPHYLAALYTQPEWAAAFAQDPKGDKGTLLPIRVKECELKGLLNQIIYIDLVGLEEDAAKGVLLAGVRRDRAKPKTQPAFPSDYKRSVVEQPRFPGTLPPIWNVPHGRNRNFTGREELLAELRATLASGEPAALTQAISGLGGVGKTQLALEYTYCHANDYGIVWWVRAEEPATLAADYAALAAPLDLPEKEAREQEVIGKAVWQWLGRNSGWLLVFDNVRDAETVRAFIPHGTTGHVVITSRNPNWGRVAGTLTVKVLERDKAAAFLLKRTQSADKKSADALAKELGYLPLALEHAGAYIEAAAISLSDYLGRYRTFKQELLKHIKPSDDYPRTVAETFEISFQEVEKASAAAADLLNLCAFLAPDDIPLDILKKGAEHLPKSLAAAVTDEISLDEAVAVLRRYSLVERTGGNLSVHRLVQAIARDRLREEKKKKWAETAGNIVNKAFPNESNDVRTWPECSVLLAHGLAVAEHAEALVVSPEATSRLLNQIGLYLHGRAEHAAARAHYERALKIDEAAYGKNHPTVAIRVNNLGLVLRDMGDLKGAKAHYERALKIDEAAYGKNHPEVATDVNNLGGVLLAQGDLEGVKGCSERALRIWTEFLGERHPDTVLARENLEFVEMLISARDESSGKSHKGKAKKPKKNRDNHKGTKSTKEKKKSL